MSQQKIKEYMKGCLPLVILFVAACTAQLLFVFPVMTHDYINYDSCYQYALTQHSIPEIFELLPYDYSPPFYAIALKLFTMVFGNSLIVMRTFSLVAIFGMYFVAAFPVRTLFGNRAAVMCLILTFCSNATLDLMTEIRPTIFAMFFFMAATVYAVTAYSREKRYAYICFTVFSVLSMYTHNVALVGIFCVYVVLLAVCLLRKQYKRLKYFFISGVISAVLYIPWLGVILSQISNVKEHFWTSSADIFTRIRWIVGESFSSIYNFYGTLILFAALSSLFFVFIRHINFKKVKGAQKIKEVIRVPEDKGVYWELLLLLLFIAASFLMLEIVILFLRNIASQRYYAIISTAWLVFFSALVGKFGSRICNLILSAVIFINLCLNINYYKAEIQEADVTNIREEINKVFADGDIAFLHTHEWSLGTMSYYFPEATHYVCDEIYTVLCTYDVFPNVVEIGSFKNIGDYTDKFIVFTTDWELNEDCDYTNNSEVIEELSQDYDVEPLARFRLAYKVANKAYDFGIMTKK